MQVGVWGVAEVERNDRVGVVGATEMEREEDMATQVTVHFSSLLTY